MIKENCLIDNDFQVMHFYLLVSSTPGIKCFSCYMPLFFYLFSFIFFNKSHDSRSIHRPCIASETAAEWIIIIIIIIIIITIIIIIIIMKSWKWHVTDWMELPNQKKKKNARRKGNQEILGNTGSGPHQTSGGERKNKEKVSQENQKTTWDKIM